MRVYLGATRSRKLIGTLESMGIGQCTQPHEKAPEGRSWFLDNGAFADWRAGRPFRANRFFRSFCRAAISTSRPDFVVVPDRVADRAGTIRYHRHWMPKLAGPVPLYIVAQDGMTKRDLERMRYLVPGEPRGVFVGGSIDWKLQAGAWIVRWAHDNGLLCHIGRVGTAPRVKWAKTIGADSIDSALPLWAERNFAPFIRAVNQGVLWQPR